MDTSIKDSLKIKRRYANEAVSLLKEFLTDNKTLTSIDLEGCLIGVAGVNHLSQVSHNIRHLTSLNLSGNDIGSEGIPHVAKLLGGATLTSLDLSYNDLFEKGTKMLADVLTNNTTLKILQLAVNYIQDEGAAHLAKMIEHNSAIEQLDLRGNQLTEKGMMLLKKALENNTTLTELNLEVNGPSTTVQDAIRERLKLNKDKSTIDDSKPTNDNSKLSPSSINGYETKWTIDPSMVKYTSPILINIKTKLNLKVDAQGNIILGQGGFGAVYLVELNKTLAALKQITPDKQYDEDKITSFKRECELLMNLRHPHIVSFLGGSTANENLFFLTEFMEHGDLYGLLAKKDLNVSWDNYGKEIALNIALGLNHLHQHKIVHRDMKSLNVLIGKGYIAKIADVGLAKIKNQTITLITSSRAMSVLWASPEQLDPEKSVSFPSDIFSFGMILWEIITQQRPYTGLDQMRLMMSVAMKKPIESLNPLPNSCPTELANLIRSCWSYDPKQRPTAEQCADVLSRI